MDILADQPDAAREQKTIVVGVQARRRRVGSSSTAGNSPEQRHVARRRPTFSKAPFGLLLSTPTLEYPHNGLEPSTHWRGFKDMLAGRRFPGDT
jgi:hypothetical protein